MGFKVAGVAILVLLGWALIEAAWPRPIDEELLARSQDEAPAPSAAGALAASKALMAREADRATAPAEEAPPVAVEETEEDFLATVDESISGARIAGNPYKFVGTRVDLHGTVGKIVDRNVFNFASSDANLAVVGDASDLEAGQWIRVVGVVAPPQEGVNLFGGVTNFPTVAAKWIETGRAAQRSPRHLHSRAHACPGPECPYGFGPSLKAHDFGPSLKPHDDAERSPGRRLEAVEEQDQEE